jgi:hypothetical protein
MAYVTSILRKRAGGRKSIIAERRATCMYVNVPRRFNTVSRKRGMRTVLRAAREAIIKDIFVLCRVSARVPPA